MTRTMKDKDNQMETSNRVFNCFSFLLELRYNSNEKRKTKGKEWKTTSCRGRAFSRSLWISPNRPRCCCPSDSCLGDRKVCIWCQKLKREEYIKEFIVCKAKPRALPMWYNQMHCIQKHLNFNTRYIATYIKKAHNLAFLHPGTKYFQFLFVYVTLPLCMLDKWVDCARPPVTSGEWQH